MLRNTMNANDSPPRIAASQTDARPTPYDNVEGRGTIFAGAATRSGEYRVLVAGRPIRVTTIGRVGADLPAHVKVWTGGKPAAETLALMHGGEIVAVRS